MKLDEAYRFGRESYGIDLAKATRPLRQAIIKEVQRHGEPIPQVIFFLMIPAYLEYLDGLTRLRLFDDLLSMRVRGVVPENIWSDFQIVYNDLLRLRC